MLLDNFAGESGQLRCGHLLAFFLNLIYKGCHMALHEFQLFILFGVDFLQSADVIHKNSLIRCQLCARPVVLLPLR